MSSAVGPHEGFGSLVREGEVALNGRLQLAGAAMDAAANLFLREEREPALHEVQP